MKQALQILIVFMAFLFLSCEKDGLNYTERQIVGSWDYTKVKYTENWSFSSSNKTYDYEDVQLEFKPNFTAHFLNTFTGATGTGLWELTQTNTNEQVVNTIYASFTNDESGELSQIVFENATINNNRIHAYYQDNDGRYRYVLEK